MSSTLKEMAAEREAARQAIANLRLSPVMFELGASPHLAQDLYRAYLEQSHIFLGIYGEEYGWVAPGQKMSGLEEEYHLAKDKPKLIYITRPAPNRDSRLQHMLRTIRDKEGISYKYFTTPEELHELIQNDLALLLTESFESMPPESISAEAIDIRPDLPKPPTPIIGREKEIKKIRELLLNDAIRLVTLTGPGGSGKTRLSIEAARRLPDQFDEIYFVELAAITDPQLLASGIAQSLGIREAGAKSTKTLLIEQLAAKKILLVLDNFEQIISGALFIAEILEKCRQAKLLITSRVILHIRGERNFPVPPLPFPDLNGDSKFEVISQYASVQLFYQRAQSIKPDFTMDEKSASAIAEICRRLDGLPLAIELAAARTRLFPPAEMLARLDKRLPILTGGSRDLPERQRTMRNAIAWSYELLDPGTAVLFRRLAVFAGGFTIEAAETVTNFDNAIPLDIFEAIENLLDNNLLLARKQQGSEEQRFELMETIREYAIEKLEESGEQAKSEQQHAEYFAQLSGTAEPFYRSGERMKWLAKMEADLDNIRAVLSRSLTARISAETGVRLAGKLGWFWHLRGHLSEGRGWTESILALPMVKRDPGLRAAALFPAGGLAWSQSDYEASVKYLGESVKLFRQTANKLWQIQSLVLLAGAIASIGDYKKSYDFANEAVELAKSINDRWGEAYSLYWLGDILILKTGNISEAKNLYEKSLSIYSDLNDPWGEAEAKGHIGIAAIFQMDYEAARINFEKSLAYMKVIRDEWAIARGLSGLGYALFYSQETEQAKSYFRKALFHWDELGNKAGIQMCLAGMARIAVEEGRLERAVTLYGAAPDPVRIVGILLAHTNNFEYRELITSLRSKMGADAWQQAYQQGNSMSLRQAMELAETD
ncbi:MAG: DUF4062 domain-containing protein [Calditrichia bacterium]